MGRYRHRRRRLKPTPAAMRAIRIYVDSELEEGGEVRIQGEPAHHLLKVLRASKGDGITLFNGRGGEYAAVVRDVSRTSVLAGVGAFVDVVRESPLEITLVQGVSRGERMDFTIQKAVELGVSAIVPVLTERSVVRLDGARRARRRDHWMSVIVNACQQCGRTRVPRLEAPAAFERWMEGGFQAAAARGFMLSPGVARTPADLNDNPRKVVLLVGPEGGLSDAERARAERAGLEPLALGPRILRTETAAVAALTALQLKWGDLSRCSR